MFHVILKEGEVNVKISAIISQVAALWLDPSHISG